MMTDTECNIRIDGETADIFFPPGSARGIQASVSQISAGELRRTVNGNLVDLTREELRKYSVSLTCDGQSLPGIDDLWRGMRCTISPPVTWIKRVPAGATSVTFARPAADAQMFDAATGTMLARPIISALSKNATFSAHENDAWVEYQPIITGAIVSATHSADEWQASATWSIEVEEV